MNRRQALQSLALGAASLPALPGMTQSAKPAAGRAMLTRRILSSGQSLAVIGLGTWQTFDFGRPIARTCRVARGRHPF